MLPFIAHNNLLINRAFIDFLKEINLSDFESLMNFDSGYVLKKKRFRSIVIVEQKNKTFYLKRHFLPWKERVKSIIPWFKKEDARNEWNNLLLLNRLGFNTITPVAFGEKKRLGLTYLSLTLTENIYDAEKLETYLPKHFAPPLNSNKISEKRFLIRKIAALARDFHDKGLNHQDFYLGHLFIKPSDQTIFIVDLQRVHRRESIRSHDLIKDLAQIAYSAQSLNIFPGTDFMRFACVYFKRSKLNRDDKKLIRKIIAKEKRISRHDAKLQGRKKEGKNSLDL
jgi:heptose I phosphotransferase